MRMCVDEPRQQDVRWSIMADARCIREISAPDGKQVEGDAWFRVDEEAHRIEWGSEGPNDYRGSLEVTDTDGGAEVQVRMHTTRVPDGNGEVQQGLDDTLATIKRLGEQQNVVG